MPNKCYIGPKTKQVAVLVSTGYGAGWSTWAKYIQYEETLAFNHKIVKAVFDGNLNEVIRIAKAKAPGCFLEGAKGLGAVWVDDRKQFRISGYDWRETLVLNEDLTWLRARKS